MCVAGCCCHDDIMVLTEGAESVMSLLEKILLGKSKKIMTMAD